MYSTYKMLSNLLNNEIEKMNEVDVCELYQKTERPDIIATYYCRYMNAIVFWHKKYNLKDESQTGSIAMECLDYCLRNYNGKSSFKTYFNNGLKRRLSSQKQLDMCKKRNCGETIDIDIVSVEYTPIEYKQLILRDLLENSNLTNDQYNYCMYYLTHDNPTDTEFRKLLKMNVNTFRILKSSLKNKLKIIYQ